MEQTLSLKPALLLRRGWLEARYREVVDRALAALLSHVDADGRLRGQEFSFTVKGVAYSGRVDGQRMRMRATVDEEQVEWTAKKLGVRNIDVAEVISFYPMFTTKPRGNLLAKSSG